MPYHAIIDENTTPQQAAPVSWTVWVYDLDRPRVLKAGDCHFPYALVAACGSLRSRAAAEAFARPWINRPDDKMPSA